MPVGRYLPTSHAYKTDNMCISLINYSITVECRHMLFILAFGNYFKTFPNRHRYIKNRQYLTSSLIGILNWLFITDIRIRWKLEIYAFWLKVQNNWYYKRIFLESVHHVSKYAIILGGTPRLQVKGDINRLG